MKNQLDADLLGAYLSPKLLHISGVSTSYHQEVQPCEYKNCYLLLVF